VKTTKGDHILSRKDATRGLSLCILAAMKTSCAAALLILLSQFTPVSLAHSDDDDLPNFNAPVDRTPLNADKVDRYLGVPLFKAPSLWDEDADVVARRVGWPQESLTTWQSSFRLYPDTKKPLLILGAQAYSCVLYAAKDQPNEISIVFANQGDYDWTHQFLAEYQKLRPQGTTEPDPAAPPDTSSTNSPPGPVNAASKPDPIAALNLSDDDRTDIQHKVQLDFEDDLKHDAKAITDALTTLFGNPTFEGFGGGSETREQVSRWDWAGHSFLLSKPRDTYVTLRIVPVAVADANGDASVASGLSSDDLRAALLKRVKQSPSGDVVVTDIPMVDQGPKGYCVPATWERYLRFLGIPADMYVLAMAAGTSNTGTNLDAMTENVDSLVTLYHRRIDTINGDLDLQTIAKNIDQGLPLMWACNIHIPFEIAITKLRAWASQLAAQDPKEIPAEIAGSPIDGGHQRMIIGYNAKTNEIAISDSWSTAFAIRWLTLTEANAINQGVLYVISP
jgi:hypothetical protein